MNTLIVLPGIGRYTQNKNQKWRERKKVPDREQVDTDRDIKKGNDLGDRWGLET